MRQRLEEFIQTNREAFDDNLPPSAVWENVQHATLRSKPRKKVISLLSLRNLAAAVTIIAISITLFLLAENKRLKQDIAFQHENSKKETDENVNDVYDSQIHQFTRLVAFKQEQLSVIKTDYPKLYQEFTTDIGELHKEYQELKVELANVPEQEIILEAMIQNLRLQAELLNEQLLIIQQLKQSKEHKNEKATKTI